MRTDAPAPAWLLGGVALWALAVWVLGLFGLGGHIDRLPPDPALVQALPSAVQPGEGRLAPLAQYSEFGARPLFMPDRRPQPFFLDPADGNEQAGSDYILTSVLLAPGVEIAIVQPAEGGDPVRLKVGDAPEGAADWRLVSVSPRSAVFDGPGGQRSLELRVFDGVGGQAPTAMAVPVQASPEVQAAASASASAGAGGQGGSGVAPVPQSPQPQPQPPQSDAGRKKAEAQAVAGAEPDVDPATTSDEQVEAIRARIEARRARMREQEQQDPARPPAPNP